MACQESSSPGEPLGREDDRTLLSEEQFPSASHPGSSASHPSWIAVIGNHLPRQCGIATFTTDLCNAIGEEYGRAQILVVAVNDQGLHYEYPARVQFELVEGDPSSYEDAAAFLNSNNVAMVSLQHEYGIYGGPAGSFILRLIRRATYSSWIRTPSYDWTPRLVS